VQWDDAFGLGLHYMHARHYSPALGRFLQPDPARADPNHFGYAMGNPVSGIDPTGTCTLATAWVWPFGTIIAGLTCSPVVWSAATAIAGTIVSAAVLASSEIQYTTRSDRWQRAEQKVRDMYRNRGYYVVAFKRFWTPFGYRVFDACIYWSYSAYRLRPNNPVFCVEVKSGSYSNYRSYFAPSSTQQAKDRYISKVYRFPVETIWVPD